MSQALINMYVSFIAMALMFISVLGAYFGRTKLSGFFKNFVLAISFICMVVAGLIVFIIVVGGPTAE